MNILDIVEVSSSPIVVAVVGQVETNSFVLFFIGNEKSLRGQQLTSIVEVENKCVLRKYKERKCGVMYMYVCLYDVS